MNGKKDSSNFTKNKDMSMWEQDSWQPRRYTGEGLGSGGHPQGQGRGPRNPTHIVHPLMAELLKELMGESQLPPPVQPSGWQA